MTTVEARACRPPTSPPSPTPGPTLGAGIRWSPSWCSPLPRSWRARGRSPRSPSGPRTHPSPVGAALGTLRDPRTGRWVWAVPTETTIRRTLGRVDPEALAAAIGAWLADRDQPDQPDQRRRAVAVDGKTLRGARRAADGRQAHLLAAMDHATRVVLAQRQVDGAPGEVPAFQPLLADLDLAGAVVTADALHTHPAAAEFLVTMSPCWTAPATAATAASSCVPSRSSPCTTSGSAPRPDTPGHPQDPRPARQQHPAVADRGRLRDHQPRLRPGQPGPACRPPPRTLGDRERPALGAGCDLRRGRLPGPDAT